jgi:hypothetical protein
MYADAEEEIPPDERIVVTALKSKISVHGVYEAIEWTVQNRARVETIGSSLFTLVLTKLLDEGVELSETHLSQGFINACFRACCATQVGQVPPKVKYGANPRRFDEKKWRRENADLSLGAEQFQARLDSAFQQHTSDREAQFASYRPIESILQQEQRALIIATPPGFAWPVLHKATSTINGAASRYKVILDNGLWMSIVARQKKVLRLEMINLLEPHWKEATTHTVRKRIIYFLLTKLIRGINGMDPVAHVMYKSQEAVEEGMRLYDIAGLDMLSTAHKERLPAAAEQKESSVYCTLELRTKKEPHRYVVYLRYLWLCLTAIRERMSADDPEAKLPKLFTIIPQMH